MDDLQRQIDEQLATLDERIELILFERAGPEALRLYVDHPEGVDLGLCERVSAHLAGLREDWALEVSSPGLDRPLTKPGHYERYLDHEIRVRTREAVEGRKSFNGRLEAADQSAITVADEQGSHQIPLTAVHRSNLVPEFSEVAK